MNQRTLPIVLILVASLVTSACGLESPRAPEAEPAAFAGEYLERYFRTFPTRATEAGRYDLDDRLEDLDAESRAGWLDYNRQVVEQVDSWLAGELAAEERLDLDLLGQQARRQVLEFGTLHRPERDPLFWTGIVGNATVFLLVRENRPLDERLKAAVARAEALPRLLAQARAALDDSAPDSIAPEHCGLAARQAAGSAEFFREGLARAAEGAGASGIPEAAARAGHQAVQALDEFVAFLGQLESRSTGSPRLGGHYEAAFRAGTGIDDPLDEVLARAEAALVAKREEAAAFGRTVWEDYFPGQVAPPSATRYCGGSSNGSPRTGRPRPNRSTASTGS